MKTNENIVRKKLTQKSKKLRKEIEILGELAVKKITKKLIKKIITK